jgi:serine/threonine protein kinase
MQSLDLSGWTPSPHPLDPTYEILTAADELPDEWLEARGVGPRSATTPTFEDIEAGTLAEIVRTHDVTHRDIRPDNLFWLDGHRVIGDLGIAHHADSAGLTEVGIKAGSWGYLPLPGEAASALFQAVSSATSRPASC